LNRNAILHDLEAACILASQQKKLVWVDLLRKYEEDNSPKLKKR